MWIYVGWNENIFFLFSFLSHQTTSIWTVDSVILLLIKLWLTMTRWGPTMKLEYRMYCVISGFNHWNEIFIFTAVPYSELVCVSMCIWLFKKTNMFWMMTNTISQNYVKRLNYKGVSKYASDLRVRQREVKNCLINLKYSLHFTLFSFFLRQILFNRIIKNRFNSKRTKSIAEEKSQKHVKFKLILIGCFVFTCEWFKQNKWMMCFWQAKQKRKMKSFSSLSISRKWLQ